MRLEKYRGPFLCVVLVVVSLLLLYTAYDKQTQTVVLEKLVKILLFSDPAASLRELNKVAALAAIGLVSIAFVIGPLSRLFPKQFAHLLSWRKFVGVSGFLLAVLHAIYSVWVIYQLDLDKMLYSNPRVAGLVVGVAALFVFFLMSITSTKRAVENMGYPNWKALQTTGYLALLFAILHFVILETKPVVGLDVRPFGLLFLALAVAALLLRIAMAVLGKKPKTNFEEHVQPPDSNK